MTWKYQFDPLLADGVEDRKEERYPGPVASSPCRIGPMSGRSSRRTTAGGQRVGEPVSIHPFSSFAPILR